MDDHLCALCLYELSAPATVVHIDGTNRTPPPSHQLLEWVRNLVQSGAPVVINHNSLTGLYAVTMVGGTRSCLGHIRQLLGDRGPNHYRR